MRKFLFIIMALPLASWAFTPDQIKETFMSQKSCSNYVRMADNKMVLGFGAYLEWGTFERVATPSPLTVIDMESHESKRVQTNDSSIDALAHNGQLILLTYEGIELRNLETLELIKVIPTHSENRTLSYKEHPTQMVKAGDKILIAHGRMGITVFDLNSMTVTNTIRLQEGQAPKESMATGIASWKNKIVVVMDSFTLTTPEDQVPAFRGLIVLNAETLAIESELNGMDPGTDSLMVHGDDLLVSFMGMPVWKYDLKKVNGKKLPRPVSVVTKFGLAGHPLRHGLLDEKYLHTCFAKHPETPQDEMVVRKIPVSIERAANKL